MELLLNITHGGSRGSVPRYLLAVSTAPFQCAGIYMRCGGVETAKGQAVTKNSTRLWKNPRALIEADMVGLDKLTQREDTVRPGWRDEK